MDMVALELIKNLQDIDHENEYYIFVKKDDDVSVLKETPNFKIIALDGGSYPVWEQIVLPKAAKKYPTFPTRSFPIAPPQRFQ